jgi:hypothetical protein
MIPLAPRLILWPMIALYVTDLVSAPQLGLAWLFVVLRGVHSAIQLASDG